MCVSKCSCLAPKPRPLPQGQARKPGAGRRGGGLGDGAECDGWERAGRRKGVASPEWEGRAPCVHGEQHQGQQQWAAAAAGVHLTLRGIAFGWGVGLTVDACCLEVLLGLRPPASLVAGTSQSPAPSPLPVHASAERGPRNGRGVAQRHVQLAQHHDHKHGVAVVQALQGRGREGLQEVETGRCKTCVWQSRWEQMSMRLGPVAAVAMLACRETRREACKVGNP